MQLERLTADVKRSFEGSIERILFANRVPVVVLEKLPINVLCGIPEKGEHADRRQERSPKRNLSPGPSEPACPETPTKRARTSDQSPRKLPRMSLIGSSLKDAKENTEYQSLPEVANASSCESASGHDGRAQTQILSVLLGVRSKGVPIVELQRLKDFSADIHFGSPARATVTTSDQEPNPGNAVDTESDVSCSLRPPPRASRRKVGKSPRKPVPVVYRETDSSDDNWSVSSLRLWR